MARRLSGATGRSRTDELGACRGPNGGPWIELRRRWESKREPLRVQENLFAHWVDCLIYSYPLKRDQVPDGG